MASFYRLQIYYKHKHRPMIMSIFKRCMQSKEAKEFMDEKAPSTAEIFKGIEEDKDRQSEAMKHKETTGIGSQTLDKARDAVKEVVMGGSPTPDSVKDSYKQESSGEDNRQTGDITHSTI